MCGIFGAFNCPKAAEITYMGLHTIQHRAQEFAGIATNAGGVNIFRQAGPGIIQDQFSQADLDRLRGRAAIGHIRYSTIADDEKLDNSQPIVGSWKSQDVAVAHNGNLVNHMQLRQELTEQVGRLRTTMDTEVILQMFCQSTSQRLASRVFDCVQRLRGTYSLLILFNDTMIAVRDPWGNRPLSLGRRNNSWFVSSETVAFAKMDIETVRDIEPGEILIITKDGLNSWYFDEEHLDSEPIPHQRAHCIFELLYFGHPASKMFDNEIVDFRLRAGAELGRVCPSPGKMIIGVPDSANFHGDGFASTNPDSRCERGLLRSHYIGRTFIEAWQALRIARVARKFTAVSFFLRGQDITLVDDSIVRMTTIPDVVKLVREAGAQSVHIRITTPPIKYPCLYGIDTPTRQELIAANKSVDQIRQLAHADSLEYLPLENLQRLVPNHQDFCWACMNGDYPIKS